MAGINGIGSSTEVKEIKTLDKKPQPEETQPNSVVAYDNPPSESNSNSGGFRIEIGAGPSYDVTKYNGSGFTYLNPKISYTNGKNNFSLGVKTAGKPFSIQAGYERELASNENASLSLAANQRITINSTNVNGHFNDNGNITEIPHPTEYETQLGVLARYQATDRLSFTGGAGVAFATDGKAEEYVSEANLLETAGGHVGVFGFGQLGISYKVNNSISLGVNGEVDTQGNLAGGARFTYAFEN